MLCCICIQEGSSGVPPMDRLHCMQVVVDAVPANCLISTCATREFDFQAISEKDLHDITIPLDLQVGAPPSACTSIRDAATFLTARPGSAKI